ncbi:glycosyltransferase [Plantactinospora sp. ZYX-F-223]|uniref:glycosyltransferase n=1 Tax=Plantactinospora sp. ZYX-F-223 TaxID=3144103 RepID=UPI0031FDF9ED
MTTEEVDRPPEADVGTVTPGVSVVVPVRGRVDETARLLASLAVAAARCPEPVDVVVVDDSTPDDARAHRANCARHGARYVRGPRHVGAKRNLGVSHARHDLLLFTDSDCRVSPELLRRYVTGIRRAPAEVAGIAGPTLVEESRTAVFRIMRRSHLLNGDLEMPRAGRSLPWATTSNLLLRRDAFRAVGGFVEKSLTVVAGEDVDLGLRLTGRGFTIRADPEATVTHDRMSSDSVRSVWRRLFGYGRSEQWLATLHPQRRTARCNPVAVLGLAGGVAVATLGPTRGRSALLVPLTAGVGLGLRAWRRRRPGDSARGVADAVACAALEYAFDVGAVVAAVQLRRPDLLFAGFRSTGGDADE